MGLFRRGIAAFLTVCMVVSSIGINVQAQSIGGSMQGMEEQEGSETEAEYLGQAGILNFVMLESTHIQTPGVQNIAVSLGQEGMAVDGAELTYRKVDGREDVTIEAAEITDNMVKFTIEYTDGAQTGIYELVSVRYRAGGTVYEPVFADLDMEVSFGVNQESKDEPDEVLVSDETLQEVEANVVSLDENGNTVSEQSIEDVLEDAGEIKQVVQMGRAAATPSKKMVIVLDPGHDSVHTGAHYNGCKEEELVLKIAQYCKTELQKYSGVTVYMTRTNGACPNGGSACLDKRVEIAVSKKADVFVSFHLNASTSTAVRGIGVYYPNSSYRPKIGQEGKGLATDIYKKLNALGLQTWAGGILIRNSENDSRYPDGSLADYLAVIRGSKEAGIPAVLVEHAFLSNAADVSQFLNSNAKLKKLGVADAQGIAEYYGLSQKADTAVPEIEWVQSRNSTKLRISWGETENAVSYKVYRSDLLDGTYEEIAEVDKTQYDDNKVKAAATYYYKVCAVFSDGSQSEYSKEYAGASLASPEISGIISRTGGKLRINWKAVSGAEQYEIWRSETSSGGYKKLATINKKTYVDSKITTQKDYFYKIRARGGEQNGYSSYSQVSSGWAAEKTAISSVSSETSTSLRIKWKKAANASGYRIQRSDSKKKGYQVVAEVKGNKNSYVDQGLEAEKKYYYKVQVLNQTNGKTGVSSYSSPAEGSTFKPVAMVYVKSNGSSNMELKWKKNANAYAYSIKRSAKKNGAYEKIAEIRDCNITQYQDKNVTGGQRYYYVVETIIKKKGVKGYSGNSKPRSAVSLKKVKIDSIQAGDDGFELTWEGVPGANCYEIMRSTKKSSGFIQVAKVWGADVVNYTDEGVDEGQEYYYRIRAVCEGKYTGVGSYGKVAESGVYGAELP